MVDCSNHFVNKNIFKVILCASEHICSSYDIASEALNYFEKIHYMY